MDRQAQRIAVVGLAVTIVAIVGYAYIAVRVGIEPIAVAPGPQHRVTERKIDGHTELVTRWYLLDGLKSADGKRIEWSAKFNANPVKPTFVFALRCLLPGWGVAETKQLIVFVCDDRRIEWKAKQRDTQIAGIMWGVVECVGTVDDLRAAAGAKRIAVVVAGVEYNLGRDGIPALAGLLRQSGRGT